MNSQHIQLLHVEYLPNNLEPGILYLSKTFEVAGHLCACGCGTKVITPIGELEWEFTENDGKASLNPSIGNWQLPCRSHYWIRDNQVYWSYQWTDKQIKTGLEAEEKKRKKYFNKKKKNRKRSFFSKLHQRILNLFS